jgi:hypothetical protein
MEIRECLQAEHSRVAPRWDGLARTFPGPHHLKSGNHVPEAATGIVGHAGAVQRSRLTAAVPIISGIVTKSKPSDLVSEISRSVAIIVCERSTPMPV